MIISQHLHPSSTSQEFIPVTLCNYNSESKLIRVSEDYREFLSIVQAAFSIILDSNATLEIQTSNLAVCQGRNVVVDHSAYPYLWKTLEEVAVRVVDLDGDVKPLASGIQVVDNIAPMVAAQIFVENIDAPVADYIEYDTTGRDVGHESRLPTPPTESYVPPKKGRGRSKQVVEDKKQGVEEEVPVKKEKVSAAKKPAKEAASTTKKRNGGRGQSKAAAAYDETPIAEEETPQEESESPPQANLDDDPLPEETRTANSPVTVLEPDADGKVEIMIYGPDGELLKFKAKPKYTMKKILVAACKNYDVEWQTAFLDLVYEDDEGTLSPPMYTCEPEDLIGSLGIDNRTRLILRVANEDMYADDPEDDEQQHSEDDAAEDVAEKPQTRRAHDDDGDDDEEDAIANARRFFDRRK